MTTTQVIVPKRADEGNALHVGLVALTEALSKIDEDMVAHGALGGEFGYGANYENAVFLMHAFCWCQTRECPWCAECHCTDTVTCPSCSPAHRWADKGALPSQEPFDYAWQHGRAPNFWHRPSGLRVWWYKWIGRSMEVKAPDGLDLAAVFAECTASISARH